jgi:leader peptidase (prepilin peptidase) / N-methyltransferase
VNALLVSGATVAGVLVGAVLDPLGQALADRSQAEDQRRRAEDERRSVDGPGEAEPREAGPLPDAPPPGAPVAGLVPSGRSPARRAAAAVVTGAIWGAVAARYGSDVIVAPLVVFFGMAVTVSFTDLSHRLIPRRLLYGAMAVVIPLLVVTSAVDHRWHSLAGSVVAGAVAFAAFFAVWWFVPRGMGFGDVRLAGAIGITVGYLSLLHAYVAFLSGFLIGVVFGVAMAVATATGRKTRIPFGPSLVAGAVIGVLWGAPLAQTLFHASP